MTFATELAIIRKYLRDPNGTIWTDAHIRHIYNDVQDDFQNKTKVLRDVAVQRVPGVYQHSYMFEWEHPYRPDGESQYYQCLMEHDSATICYRWEVQQIAGLQADVQDYGTHFTHPWEAYMCTPGEEIRLRFPSNFHQMEFIAYDEEPIGALTRRQVQGDPAYITHVGDPFGYYVTDEVDNSYVLYPRPNVGFADELDYEGAAFALSGDSEDATAGIIATRDQAFDPSYGVPVDLIGTSDNVFMVYQAKPTDMDSSSDTSDYPTFMLKYIRAGTIARAYGSNTDGRIRSLADYWNMRYQAGISLVRKYLNKKKQDRDYVASTGPFVARRHRHPRLPDRYPAV